MRSFVTMTSLVVIGIFVLCGVSTTFATDNENAVVRTRAEHASASTRPPYYDKARRARYIVHKANWAIITTISTKPGMLGRSFPAPNSLSDGPLDNGSGTPYFYLAMIDSTMHDVAKNPNVTVSFSEAEFSDVSDCVISPTSDPESPLCARLMLLGKLVQVTDPTETAFAKTALFSRHPLMPTWPTSHDFRFIKLVVEDIWILDFFGGGSSLSVEDYYNAKP